MSSSPLSSLCSLGPVLVLLGLSAAQVDSLGPLIPNLQPVFRGACGGQIHPPTFSAVGFKGRVVITSCSARSEGQARISPLESGSPHAGRGLRLWASPPPGAGMLQLHCQQTAAKTGLTHSQLPGTRRPLKVPPLWERRQRRREVGRRKATGGQGGSKPLCPGLCAALRASVSHQGLLQAMPERLPARPGPAGESGLFPV